MKSAFVSFYNQWPPEYAAQGGRWFSDNRQTGEPTPKLTGASA
jgi:hypothetical protein